MKVWCNKSGIATAALAVALSTALATPVRAEDGELTVFDWAGYEDPGFHALYIEKHEDSPTFSFFADEEEAFQKLRAGFRADVAHPCSQSVARWRDAGLLEPIDTSKIPEWNNIMEGIKAMPNLMTSADGKAWVIPFEWGNTSLIYNTEKVDAADVKSLKAFADPKFQGRVSIGDNVDDAYALAGLVVGVKDWTTMTDEQFAAASEFLRGVHKNVRLYWTDNTELVQAMAGGEVDLSWGWNETVTTLKGEGKPFEMNKATDEGISTWVCGYSLLKDGEGNKDKAYDYLNAVIDQKVTPYLMSEWGYGHGNGKGMAALDIAMLKEKGFDNIDAFVDKTLFQSPLPESLRQKMIAEFEKIKAGY